MTRTSLLLLLAAAAPAVAQAQAAAPAKAAKAAKPNAALVRAAATITEADVARRIGIIAHDSMGGRDTPSRGLDLTASYLASEYKRIGLEPAGDSGTYFQRYAITRRKLDPAASTLTVTTPNGSVTTKLSEGARYYLGAVPSQPVEGEVVMLGGAIDPTKADQLPIRGKIAFYVGDYATAEAAGRSNQVLRALRAAEPKAVVLVSNRSAEQFAVVQKNQARERSVLGDAPAAGLVAIEVRDSVLQALAASHDVSFAEVRASTQPIVDPAAQATARIALVDQVVDRKTAPNVVAVLRGTDPALRNEYVVFSAHMDHDGTAGEGSSCTAQGADSICNGADDDASGTVALVELAEAYAQKGARPKRSMVFLNVSGEEKGLWGSEYFSEHPTLPLKDIVANINADMIGRNWKDTIVVIGKEHSDLGATLNRVNAAHPELGMTAIDDIWPQERFYFRSDHYNFARKGVPILFFFNGVHADYHRPSDSPDKIDAEKESRIVRLMFYLGHEIGSTQARPQWNPESYKEIVEGAGGR
jgi:hypothetical protein